MGFQNIIKLLKLGEQNLNYSNLKLKLEHFQMFTVLLRMSLVHYTEIWLILYRGD